MQFNRTVDDALVPALSEQLQGRIPIAVDARGVPTETAAAHVTRALNEWIDSELGAARRRAADAAIVAAEQSQDDAALQSALLARHKVDAAR